MRGIGKQIIVKFELWYDLVYAISASYFEGFEFIFRLGNWLFGQDFNTFPQAYCKMTTEIRPFQLPLHSFQSTWKHLSTNQE